MDKIRKFIEKIRFFLVKENLLIMFRAIYEELSKIGSQGVLQTRLVLQKKIWALLKRIEVSTHANVQVRKLFSSDNFKLSRWFFPISKFLRILIPLQLILNEKIQY